MSYIAEEKGVFRVENIGLVAQTDLLNHTNSLGEIKSFTTPLQATPLSRHYLCPTKYIFRDEYLQFLILYLHFNKKSAWGLYKCIIMHSKNRYPEQKLRTNKKKKIY